MSRVVRESDGRAARGLPGLCRRMLEVLGENPDRPGLLKTPERMAGALRELTRGYREDPAAAIGDAIFDEGIEEMVLVRDIEFFSLCEHHTLPFFGKAHVAYIPRGRIVGISKLARLVEVFSRRLQVQERLTQEVASCLQEHLKPAGVGVVMEARHLCMMMRGIQKLDAVTITSAMLGSFRENPSTRAEFLSLIQGGPRGSR